MQMLSKVKLIRTSTVSVSLNILLKGQLEYLNRYFNLVAISGAGKDIDEVREREGVEIIPVEMQRQISPIKDILSLVNLYRVFRKEKPTIVHSITPKAGLLSMLAGRLAGVPIRMHTFTGLIFPTKTGLMQKLLIQMDRLLCLSATHIYPEGNGVKNDLIKYKITQKPLKVIANGNINGIDTEYFSSKHFSEEYKANFRESLGISQKDFVYIFVGRLVKDKGINELVTAFSRLKAQNLKLLLVGPFESEIDPLSSEILNEIQYNKNIISVGFQKDVRPYFAISNCLVFPSYREGFPNVVIQAGAMELPSIVSNINGCNEIIVNGQNGVIIPSKNIDRLEEQMLLLYNDKALYGALQSKSREMVISRYRQEFVWQELLKEYQQLIKEKNV